MVVLNHKKVLQPLDFWPIFDFIKKCLFHRLLPFGHEPNVFVPWKKMIIRV